MAVYFFPGTWLSRNQIREKVLKIFNCLGRPCGVETVALTGDKIVLGGVIYFRGLL